MTSQGPKAQSQDYFFRYTDETKEVYRDIIDLKLEQAQSVLDKHTASNNNLAFLHLQSYLDFFALFISEDAEYLKEAQKRKGHILKKLEKLPDSDPYKRYAMAEVHLHSAINRSKFDQMIKSAREILTAYKLLKENQALFPDFIYNKKSLSVIHSLAETVSIPGIVKKLLGIDGTIQQGLREIEDVIAYSHADDDFLFLEEVDAIYLYILLYQAKKTTLALNYLDRCRLDPSESLLSTFMVAKILQKCGKNNEAIKVLEAKPKGDSYSPFYYLDLMEGIAKLRKLEPGCTAHIESYLQSFRGRHYIKEAYQKLGWAKLVFEEDLPGYKYYMSQSKSAGHALVDADKQAQNESNNKMVPEPILLKARLLFDGGSYQKAYVLLAQQAFKFTTLDIHTLEFNYRMGRICQALQNYPEALGYYNTTILQGREAAAHYACNAALQSGIIYETMNYKKEARRFFEMSLEITPEDYRNSLHQKAKSGLARLRNQVD